MRASGVLFCVCVCLFYIFHQSSSQFFTKTTNSIPRLGRRTDTLLPNLVRRVAKQLHFVIKMVNDYDKDGDGELNAEELIDNPFIQNAVKSEIEARELQELPEKMQRENPNQMGAKD